MIMEGETLQTKLRDFRKGQSTPLGISSVSKYTIVLALRAASKLNAPVVFVASFNHVDVDGGYTGFTPGKFVENVDGVTEEEILMQAVFN